MKKLLLFIGVVLVVISPAQAADYRCNVESKLTREHVYPQAHLQKYQFSPEFKIISPALVLMEGAYFQVNNFCRANLEGDLAWEAC